jgi:hypothetical protein
MGPWDRESLPTPDRFPMSSTPQMAKPYLGESWLAGIFHSAPSYSIFISFVLIERQCLNMAFHVEVQYY